MDIAYFILCNSNTDNLHNFILYIDVQNSNLFPKKAKFFQKIAIFYIYLYFTSEFQTKYTEISSFIIYRYDKPPDTTYSTLSAYSDSPPAA